MTRSGPGTVTATMSDARAQPFLRWIDAYERAWRTPGTAGLHELFHPAATYRAALFDEPLVGLDAIATFWEAEREGPDEVFTLTAAIVAAQGPTAVARLEVRYDRTPERPYRDLWIITLDDRGRATAFEEWPFFPGQPRAAGE